MRKKAIKLAEEDYKKHGIQEFLDCVAKKMNVNTDLVEYYNITKIVVAKNIHEALIQHYIEKGMSRKEVIAVFTCYAPKVSSKLGENQVLVAEGFCLLRVA